jgi:hypothetical protein
MHAVEAALLLLVLHQLQLQCPTSKQQRYPLHTAAQGGLAAVASRSAGCLRNLAAEPLPITKLVAKMWF